MACFLVPATEAIVTTIVAKAVKSHEAKTEEQTKVKTLSEDKLPLSKKITRLSGFLTRPQQRDWISLSLVYRSIPPLLSEQAQDLVLTV